MDGSYLTYEDLSGAAGRAAFIRAPRYAAQDLTKDLTLNVLVNNSPTTLENISLTGALLAVPGNFVDPEPSASFPLELQCQGENLLRTQARVVRQTRSKSGRDLIAVEFIETLFDRDDALTKIAKATARMKLTGLDLTSGSAVSPEYKILCADVLDLLQASRTFLDENMGDVDEASLVELCFEHIREPWDALWERGNAHTKAVLDDAEKLAALKAFTERVVTPEFVNGAVSARCYDKPLGYPGDYEVMNQTYDWDHLGDTVYKKLLHRIGLHGLRCVRTRMTMMAERLCAEAIARGGALRAMNIGCGSAREIGALLELEESKACRFDFTLIDQDANALESTLHRHLPNITGKDNNATLRCINISFNDILRGRLGSDDLPQQDVIYSLGLFDYLKDRRAKALIEKLYTQLSPGGLIAIANVNDAALNGLWMGEALVDWSLIYRDDATMCSWARDLDAEVWTETESTEGVRFVFIRKPT